MSAYVPIPTFARPRKIATDRAGNTFDQGPDNRSPMDQVPGTGGSGLDWLAQNGPGRYAGAGNTNPAPKPDEGGYDTTGIGYEHYHDMMHNQSGGLGQDGKYLDGWFKGMNQSQARAFSQKNWTNHGPTGQQRIVQQMAPLYGQAKPPTTSTPAPSAGTASPATGSTPASARPTVGNPGTATVPRPDPMVTRLRNAAGAPNATVFDNGAAVDLTASGKAGKIVTLPRPNAPGTSTASAPKVDVAKILTAARTIGEAQQISRAPAPAPTPPVSTAPAPKAPLTNTRYPAPALGTIRPTTIPGGAAALTSDMVPGSTTASAGNPHFQVPRPAASTSPTPAPVPLTAYERTKATYDAAPPIAKPFMAAADIAKDTITGTAAIARDAAVGTATGLYDANKAIAGKAIDTAKSVHKSLVDSATYAVTGDPFTRAAAKAKLAEDEKARRTVPAPKNPRFATAPGMKFGGY